MASRSTSNTARVLVVDDDPALAEMLTIVLHSAGFDTQVVERGDLVLDALNQFRPDVILLDVMLPGYDGMQVCEQVRKVSGVPIVMVTARADSDDIVAGLEAGADDYVTKPFRKSELIARVKARLRDREPLPGPVDLGEIAIDPTAHVVTRCGEPLQLTPLEFDLLACLASDPSRVFSREELLHKVWGYEHVGDTKLVNVHMTRLRAKIDDDADDPKVIRTVRGVGYQAIAPEIDAS
jgi:two-component system, OmpR family, response regulator MtrA